MFFYSEGSRIELFHILQHPVKKILNHMVTSQQISEQMTLMSLSKGGI